MLDLTITLDPAAKEPMYEQLYRIFVEQIRSGSLRQDEKLPSKRSLCAHLKVSMSTVETAYDLLVSEGYVRARPKSGYYAAEYANVESGSRSLPPQPAPPAPRQRPEFDLSTGSVDVRLFPYASWAKLHREVVYGSPELLQRGDRQGDYALRLALCEFLREYRGVRCVPEQLVVGAGIEYLIGLLLSLLPKDAVFALEDPGYPAFFHTVRGQDRPCRFLPLDGEGLSLAALEQSDATVAFITPSHQFPMGVTMPASRRSQLLRWAAQAPERYLIEDDYDSEFRYTSRPIPALQGMDGLGRVIYVGTFSRSLAPSIRLAYAVLPQALLERYAALPGSQHSTVSRYEQAVMARFLHEGYYARYLRRVGNLYRQRRAALLEALGTIPEVTVSGDGGGIHFLLHAPQNEEQELCRLARERGVVLHGLSAYCRGTVPCPSTVVIGYGGLQDEKIPMLAALLREAWA